MSEKLSRRSALAAGLGVIATASLASAGDKNRRQQPCCCQCQQPVTCCDSQTTKNATIHPLADTNVCRQFQFANFGNGVFGYYSLSCDSGNPMAWYGPSSNAAPNGCVNGANCDPLNKFEGKKLGRGNGAFSKKHKADKQLANDAPLVAMDADTQRTPMGIVAFPSRNPNKKIFARIAKYEATKNGTRYVAYCGEEIDGEPGSGTYTVYAKESDCFEPFKDDNDINNIAEVRFPPDSTGQWYLITTKTEVVK